MSEALKKPFSKSFVMNTTHRHMVRSIDISIEKTFTRLQDAQNQSASNMELMETLSALHTWKKVVNEFKTQNAALFASEVK